MSNSVVGDTCKLVFFAFRLKNKFTSGERCLLHFAFGQNGKRANQPTTELRTKPKRNNAEVNSLRTSEVE